jgi:phage baseplate assembly protein W
MAEFDFKDHYIGYNGHPRFIVNKIVEDDVIRVIIQKYEMLLFTNKGELLGDPDFGCDLPILLFQTKVSAEGVRKIILQQIRKYIPELSTTNFELKASFFQDPENFQDVLQIDFTLADYEVYAIIS